MSPGSLVSKPAVRRSCAEPRPDVPIETRSALSARTPCLAVAAVAAALMSACGPGGESGAQRADVASEPAEPAVGQQSGLSAVNVSGETAYRAACAHCHDTGVDGAPVTGDPDSWSNRSPLWESVLADHAKSGYLAMPARGGVDTLPDSVVSRATEYMLLQTFPDRPPDDD